MSTAAVMLVKDEADVIEYVLQHLAANVDEIYVADNGSTDGTREILDEIELPVPLTAADDPEVGHYQSRKTTELAMLALADGHAWVVPCDADEIWYSTDGRRVADLLAGQAPDVQVVKAELFHHLPTALDPPADPISDEHRALAEGLGSSDALEVAEPNPFRRIGWRNRERGSLPKVACRLRPDLVIHDGNHGASTSGTGLSAGGLVVRHFSWRSEEQYLRKIRNGALAFAATDLPETTGAHWRMHGDPEASDFEERVREHFRSWFFSQDPLADDALIYDPATPLLGGT